MIVHLNPTRIFLSGSSLITTTRKTTAVKARATSTSIRNNFYFCDRSAAFTSISTTSTFTSTTWAALNQHQQRPFLLDSLLPPFSLLKNQQKQDQSLPFQLSGAGVGAYEYYHHYLKNRSFLPFVGHSPSSLPFESILKKSDDNTLSISYSYQMPFGIGNGSISSSCNIGVGVVPSTALSLVSTACCWSVLILLLLSGGGGINGGSSRRSHCNLNRWSTIIPTAARSMSSYSMIFAEAFHPSTSYSAEDNENGNDSDNKNNKESTPTGSDTKTNSDDKKLSPDTSPNSSEDDETTCDANNNNNNNNDDDDEDEDDGSIGRFHPDDDRLQLFHFESTTSTQDEAKKVAEQLPASITAPTTFCVTATSQLNGRGTTGRQWMGAPGNVFVTIGIPVQVWMTSMFKERNIPLTLLPLKIGDITASLIQSQLYDCGAKDAAVTVKWPNDVLVDGKKISGTLIESSNNWFLIGIGINIAYAPTVPTTGNDYGRPSVSLKEYGCSSSGGDDPQKEEADRDNKARDLGVQLALNFHRWIYDSENPSSSTSSSTPITADSIVQGWKRWLDFDTELTMRNDDAPPLDNGKDQNNRQRRVVKLLDVLPDGRIRVQNKDDGKEEILVSDYFV